MKSPHNKTLKIVVADDDLDDIQLMALAFKEANLDHHVEFVNDGEELTEYLQAILDAGKKEELPDLILLDLNMPKKDGRTALKEIRSNPDLNKLRVVMFSTCISAEDSKYIESLGVSGCMTKPCGFFELVEIVNSVCDACIENLQENKLSL